MTEPDVLAIDCSHLVHRYGHFTAVDDFSLQVRTGETVGLLGPNGAGKTTVVRVLTTLTPVHGGEVKIFGLDSRRNTMSSGDWPDRRFGSDRRRPWTHTG